MLMISAARMSPAQSFVLWWLTVMLLVAGFHPEGIIVLGLHLENSVFSHLLITDPSKGNFSSLVLPRELLWQNFTISACVDKHSMHVVIIL